MFTISVLTISVVSNLLRLFLSILLFTVNYILFYPIIVYLHYTLTYKFLHDQFSQSLGPKSIHQPNSRSIDVGLPLFLALPCQL
uniref:Uncharacterized protein n=1 Tax=Oryza brachyantha TaxID=4533 RepID=J3LJE9_ORYBR